ncbi:MerR family transcriptional regulator [Enterococcus sp. LJL51]|uniref:MerR family transcriptional regulator n=1 Tax=Enterococcus sp. LJL51 TaxID=3416656 RepID=UPI003CECD0C5
MNIAQFSKISGVSVSTLHYYDRQGLFSPSGRIAQNGYRTYSAEQLPELNQLLVLKDSGFKLAEIKELLTDSQASATLSQRLAENITALENDISQKKQMIRRIQTNLFLLQNGGIPVMNEIIIKTVEPILGASIRRSFKKKNPKQTFDAFSEEVWHELETAIQTCGGQVTTPCLTIYREGLFLKQESPIIDQEIIEPLVKELKLPPNSDVTLTTLPAEQVVSAIHEGKLNSIGETYTQMLDWIEQTGLTISGFIREIYHQENITELQIPVNAKSLEKF